MRTRVLACLALLAGAAQAGAAVRKADVVVYGATPAGLVAAVAAARQGKAVLLLQGDAHVGGMVTGGLGATDTGNRAAIGGVSREFFDRVRAYYAQKYGPRSRQVAECSGGFHFEPHVAALVFRAMLREARVEVLTGRRLAKVAKAGPRLTALTTAAGEVFAGRVFIDATYEGDLLAAAGVKYHVGREGRTAYGESLAGVQVHSRAHQFSVKVNGLGEAKKLLPFVQPGPAGTPGRGDRKVQAYNFRLCLTDRPDNRAAFPRPPGYDPARYELLARYLKASPGLKVGQLMNPVRMPNGKTDVNNNGPFSTDHIGANWDYPEADFAARQRIRLDHVHYTQGFLYFLANDPGVPAALQKEMRRWGLAKDEFADTGHWPPQLYVREARRMVGAYVMTQADIMTRRTKDDSVGLGSYNTDSHHVQRVVRADGSVVNEGDFQEPVSPYAIPYRSLTPKAAECDNLLVPVCVSASHVAYGTVRMEPVYMILGHAAGVAAALAVDADAAVQEVSAQKLTSLLKKQKAVLSPTGLPARVRPRGLEPARLGGVVVDDREARLTGPWQRSTAAAPFVGDGYVHDGNDNKGKMHARFTPKLPAAGAYAVYLYYAPASNRATNVPVVVHAAGGDKRLTVDQRKAWKGEGGLLLGTFSFAAGEAGWVQVGNDGTVGHVVADAVRFVKATPPPRPLPKTERGSRKPAGPATFRTVFVLLPLSVSVRGLGGGVLRRASPDDLNQWVKDLASEDPAVWRAASLKLWKAGRRAEAVLRAAAKSADADLVLRARLVLERFEWGIFPETPAAVVAAIERYRAGDDAARKAAVAELIKRGGGGFVALRRVLARETDAGMRRHIGGVLKYQGRALARDLLARGDRQGALELLEARAAAGADGMRDLAAYWVLTSLAASRAEMLQREAAGGDRTAAAQLAYLHRAAGELPAAVRAAGKAGDDSLLADLAAEQLDFRTLARLNPPRICNDPARLAVVLHHAGDAAGSAAALARVPEKEPWRRVSVAFATGRPNEAVRLYLRIGSFSSACKMMALQGRWREALALAPGEPTATPDAQLLLLLEQAAVAGRAGEKDRAKRLFAAAAADLHRAAGLDFLLAEVVRVGTRLGWRKEALGAVGKALDKIHAHTMFSLPRELSANDGEAVSFWWAYLRRKQPGTPASATLARLDGWFGQKKADKDFDALIAGVEAETDWPVTQKDRWPGAAAAGCLAVGKAPKAEEVLRAAASTRKTAAAHHALADLLFAGKRWAEAEAEYARAAQAGPADALPVYLRGVALGRMGQPAEGRRVVGRARLMALADEEARYNLAVGLEKRGLAAEAAREWLLLLRTAPFSSVYATNAAGRLAGWAAGHDRPLEAAFYYRRAYLDLALGGGAFLDAEAYLQVPALAHAYQARGLAAAGKWDEALGEAKASLALLPGQDGLVIDLVAALDRAGRKADADRFFADEFARHERACVGAPKSAGQHNQAAWLAARCRRQMDRGLRHARAATKLEPDAPGCLDTLAELYFQRGEGARAVAAMARAVRLAPGRAYYAAQLRRMRAGDRDAPVPKP
jgi:Flp pilus assembly protein TadD